MGHQDILINAHWLMPLREMLHRIDGDLCLVAGDEKPCAYLGADDVAPLCGKAGESWFGWMGCGLSSVASVLTGEAEQQAWTEAELLSGRDPNARPLEPPPLALPEAAEAAKRMLPSMDEAKRMLPNMDGMLPKMDDAFKVIPDPTNMMNDVGRWAQEGAKTVEEGLLTGQEVARRFMTGLWRLQTSGPLHARRQTSTCDAPTPRCVPSRPRSPMSVSGIESMGATVHYAIG